MAYPGNDPTEDRRTEDGPAGEDGGPRESDGGGSSPRPADADASSAAGGERRSPSRRTEAPTAGSPDRGKPTRAESDTRGRAPDEEPLADRDGLYFFPDEAVSEKRVRWILQQGSAEERVWVVSHLLRYAQWDDLWQYVSRDEVREIFPQLDLPDRLRQAWARMLKVEAPVG